MHHSPTGNKTLLHNLLTNSKNGSSIALPKNHNSSAGVNDIPAILLMTVLHSAVATLPPLADVNSMHMLIVVGKHVRMSTPSSSGFGSRAGRIFSMPLVRGKPTKNGQAPKVVSWMRMFSFMFFAALASSDILRDRPERRKIMVTPYFPMNSSGQRMLLFFPSCKYNHIIIVLNE